MGGDPGVDDPLAIAGGRGVDRVEEIPEGVRRVAGIHSGVAAGETVAGGAAVAGHKRVAVDAPHVTAGGHRVTTVDAGAARRAATEQGRGTQPPALPHRVTLVGRPGTRRVVEGVDQ